MGRIDIALASDQNYFVGLIVTACSIARYASRGRCLVFHILDGGIDAASFQLLETSIRQAHPNSEVDRIYVNDSRWDDLLSWHGSRMTYARLLLPNYLPDVDHIIYADVDTLWLVDIAELWDLRNVKKPIQGCREYYNWPGLLDDEMAFYRAHNLEFCLENNINAGVLIMNLRLMREENFVEQVFSFLEMKPPLNDQTAFNALLSKRIGLLPVKWNVLSRDLTADNFKDGAVIHYAGAYQPWRANGLRWMFADNLMLWHRFNAKIRGVSLWKSISINCRLPEYVYRRLMFYLFALPVLKQIMIYIFSHTGERQRWWLRYYYLCHNSILKWSYD